MINIDKDYLITVDLKNTKVKSDKTIFFYNTDLNICNIFIKLICSDKDKTIPDDLIVEFAVLKPETDEFKPLDATLISKEDLLYQVDLTTDYFDIVGKYSCEIRVSGTIENESKCFTSEEFDYVVKPNITAKLDKKIKNDKNLPILEKLIKDVKEVTEGINKNEIQMKRDENLVGDNKTVVGAINQLREDVNSGIGGGTAELKDYQKKNDEFLNTNEKTITGGINEVNNKIKKVQENQIELDKDDVSFNGIDDISHDTLTTTNKKIIPAINEVNSQLKDIANLFSTEQATNSYKIKCGNKVIAEIPLGSTTPTVIKYTITNTLSNAINNNNATEIEGNQSYTATITANEGYSINSVIITMGGTDITNTVYNNGNINISSVTGDLVITVKCTEIVQPTSYSIINNLTNYTNDNKKTSIEPNTKYVAKLEPILEYEPTSLSITMGGINITDIAYNKESRTVSIDKVTGDIIITVKGEKIPETIINKEETLTMMRGHNTVMSDGTYGNTWTAGCYSEEYIEVNTDEIIISANYNGLVLNIMCYDENKVKIGEIYGQRGGIIYAPWTGDKTYMTLRNNTKFIRLGFIKASNYKWFYNIQPLYKDVINGYVVINNNKYVLSPYCNNSITGVKNLKVDGNFYCGDVSTTEIKSYNSAVNSITTLNPVTTPLKDKSFYDIEFICDENNAIIDSLGNVTRLSDKEFTVTIKVVDGNNNYTTDVIFEALDVESVNSINTLNMGIGETYSIPYSTSPVINYSDSVSLKKPNTDDIIKINKDNSITALKDGTSTVNLVAKNFTKTIPVVVGKEISSTDEAYL